MTDEMKRYYATRKRFMPERGKVYENQGGGSYVCLQTDACTRIANMQNTASGWTFQAHDLGMYEDGRIDWDFSTNGYFAEVSNHA